MLCDESKNGILSGNCMADCRATVWHLLLYWSVVSQHGVFEGLVTLTSCFSAHLAELKNPTRLAQTGLEFLARVRV